MKIGRTPDAIVLHWQETGPTFVSVTDAMPGVEALEIMAAANGRRSYAELKEIAVLAPRFGVRRLLLILDVVAGRVDGESWADQVVDWLNDESARRAEADNMSRVRAAIPQPPGWDIGAISDACWVLESAEGVSQGTAFALEGVGFVTCHHVVHAHDGTPHSDLEMFHVDDPGSRFAVTIVSTNEVLDLALVRSDAPSRGSLGYGSRCGHMRVHHDLLPCLDIAGVK